MSLTIQVDADSGYKANERPRQFCLDDDVFEIVGIEDRWYDPNGEYFKVRTAAGKRYILRYAAREDQWTLQSGFDGTELLARPGIELVTVEPSAIRHAESKIAGCERCRSDESEISFDWILADVLGKHGARSSSSSANQDAAPTVTASYPRGRSSSRRAGSRSQSNYFKALALTQPVP